MKRTILMSIQVAVICLLAAGAMAQSDPVGDQTQRHNYNDAPGIDANGGIHRHGDEFAGVTGPHGPFGAGPDDELLKFLGLTEVNCGLFSGEMWQKSWGPGGSQSGVESPGHFGPNVTGSGFGPGGDGECSGDGTADGDMVRNRAGRR